MSTVKTRHRGSGRDEFKTSQFLDTHTRPRNQTRLGFGTEEYVHTRSSYKDRRHTERVYKIRGAANISYIAPVHSMRGFGFHIFLELLNTQKESERILGHE